MKKTLAEHKADCTSIVQAWINMEMVNAETVRIAFQYNTQGYITNELWEQYAVVIADDYVREVMELKAVRNF